MGFWKSIKARGSKIISQGHKVVAEVKMFAADVVEIVGYDEVANSWRDSAEKNLRKAAEWKQKAEKFKRLGDLEDKSKLIGRFIIPDSIHRPKEAEREIIEKSKDQVKDQYGPNVGNTLVQQSIPQRLHTIRNIAHEAAQIFGVDVNDVIFDPDMNCMGSYKPGTKYIKINPTYLCVNDPKVLKEVVGTVFHEMVHARQWAAATLKADYGYDDRTLVEYIWNFKNYIRPEWDDFSYYHQPLERDAYGIEKEIMSDL